METFKQFRAVTIVAGAGLRVLARARDQERALLTTSAVLSATVTVADLDTGEIAYQSDVIDSEDIIFDTLQVVDEWTADAIGYNLAHNLPAEAFPEPNKRYELTFWFDVGLDAPICGSKMRVNTIHAYAPE